MPSWCNKDLTVIKIELPRREGCARSVVIASAYSPYDSVDDPPPNGVRKLIRYCQEEGVWLVLGCDANAHHTIWGSTNINPRGEALLTVPGTNQP